MKKTKQNKTKRKQFKQNKPKAKHLENRNVFIATKFNIHFPNHEPPVTCLRKCTSHSNRTEQDRVE